MTSNPAKALLPIPTVSAEVKMIPVVDPRSREIEIRVFDNGRHLGSCFFHSDGRMVASKTMLASHKDSAREALTRFLLESFWNRNH